MSVPCTTAYYITVLKLEKYVCAGVLIFLCLCNIRFV
jgi:hypothetical protein